MVPLVSVLAIAVMAYPTFQGETSGLWPAASCASPGSCYQPLDGCPGTGDCNYVLESNSRGIVFMPSARKAVSIVGIAQPTHLSRLALSGNGTVTIRDVRILDQVFLRGGVTLSAGRTGSQQEASVNITNQTQIVLQGDDLNGSVMPLLSLGRVDGDIVPAEIIVNSTARRLPAGWRLELIKVAGEDWAACEAWRALVDNLWNSTVGQRVRNERMSFGCVKVPKYGLIEAGHTALVIQKKAPVRGAAEPLVLATFCVVCAVVGMIAGGISIAKAAKDKKIFEERQEFIRFVHESGIRVQSVDVGG